MNNYYMNQSSYLVFMINFLSIFHSMNQPEIALIFIDPNNYFMIIAKLLLSHYRLG
jgi:hypothetical protein